MKKIIFSFVLVIFVLSGCGDKKNVEQGEWLIMKDDPTNGTWAVMISSSEIKTDLTLSTNQNTLKIIFKVQNGNEKKSIMFGKTNQTIEVNGKRYVSEDAGRNDAKENSIDPMKESQRTVSFSFGDDNRVTDDYKWIYNDGKTERTIKFYPTK